MADGARGGARPGGGLYFALDVTDPETPQPLWEFTDPLLAHTIAAPAIGRVFVGGVERPVVFLSGGVDQSAAPTDPHGQAFFVLDLISGNLLRYFAPVPTASGASGTVQGPLDAPLSGSPTAYMDAPTTFTTRVFVGDFKGRMWRIDTSSPNTLDWKMTLLWPNVDDAEAWESSPHKRPIFLAPSAALDPALQIILYYGTGDIQNLDAGENNYLWAIREEFKLSDATVTALGKPVSTKFPIAFGANEKMMGEPVVFNGVVLFTTFVASEGICGFGEGRLYGIDYLTGDARMTTAGALTYAGDESATAYYSLGAGVPSTPAIRQQPASITYNAHGELIVTGGLYTALIQTGAHTRTDQVQDTTRAVNLGAVSRRADVMSVVELE